MKKVMRLFEISIHAPHEGERPEDCAFIRALDSHFNPRSPRGGATRCRATSQRSRSHFNPRSPRGGATLRRILILNIMLTFQSTLPTRGSDYYRCKPSQIMNIFQSTLPTRGSDFNPHPLPDDIIISIHAPHEGERPIGTGTAQYPLIFQSTLPTRGSDASAESTLKRVCVHFNPRSPRGGATAVAPPPWVGLWDFNPRSPRGGATSTGVSHPVVNSFQSTLPTRGSDSGKVHLYTAFPRIC